MTKIKDAFLKDIIVAEYCLDKFKEELKRTDSDGIYRLTRKSKLNSLRKELNSILLQIEREYQGGIYNFEKVSNK